MVGEVCCRQFGDITVLAADRLGAENRDDVSIRLAGVVRCACFDGVKNADTARSFSLVFQGEGFGPIVTNAAHEEAEVGERVIHFQDG